MSEKHVGKLILLMGPSGVGKGTTHAMLKERHPEFVYPLSITTRAKRPGEKDGETYHFVDSATFDAYIQENKVLEWATVHQYDRYGTLKEPIVKALQEGKMVIREIDIQGCKQVLASEIKDRIVTIFIFPPSLEHLKNRILKRSTMSDKELKARLDDASMEMEYGKTCQYQVISYENEQEKVYREIEGIILKEANG